MNRRDVIKQLSAVSTTLALPTFARVRPIVLGESAALSGQASALGEQFKFAAQL